MQQHIAFDDLIQGGLERRKQIVWQMLNEANAVSKDGVPGISSIDCKPAEFMGLPLVFMRSACLPLRT